MAGDAGYLVQSLAAGLPVAVTVENVAGVGSVGIQWFQARSSGQPIGTVTGSVFATQGGAPWTTIGSVAVTQASTLQPFTVIVTSTQGGGSTITGSVVATQGGAPWSITGSVAGNVQASVTGQLFTTASVAGTLPVVASLQGLPSVTGSVWVTNQGSVFATVVGSFAGTVVASVQGQVTVTASCVGQQFVSASVTGQLFATTSLAGVPAFVGSVQAIGTIASSVQVSSAHPPLLMGGFALPPGTVPPAVGSYGAIAALFTPTGLQRVAVDSGNVVVAGSVSVTGTTSVTGTVVASVIGQPTVSASITGQLFATASVTGQVTVSASVTGQLFATASLAGIPAVVGSVQAVGTIATSVQVSSAHPPLVFGGVALPAGTVPAAVGSWGATFALFTPTGLQRVAVDSGFTTVTGSVTGTVVASVIGQPTVTASVAGIPTITASAWVVNSLFATVQGSVTGTVVASVSGVPSVVGSVQATQQGSWRTIVDQGVAPFVSAIGSSTLGPGIATVAASATCPVSAGGALTVRPISAHRGTVQLYTSQVYSRATASFVLSTSATVTGLEGYESFVLYVGVTKTNTPTDVRIRPRWWDGLTATSYFDMGQGFWTDMRINQAVVLASSLFQRVYAGPVLGSMLVLQIDGDTNTGSGSFVVDAWAEFVASPRWMGT